MAEGQPSGENRPSLSFTEKLASLTEPVAEGQSPLLTDTNLRRLANLADQPRNQTPGRLRDIIEKADSLYARGRAPEEQWALLAGLLQEERERLDAARAGQRSAAGKPGAPRQTAARLDVNRLADSIFGLEQRLARGEQIDLAMLQAQKDQVEMWTGGGYDAFVSTEEAQMAIDPRLFETQPAAWYRGLDDRWQEVIRSRITVLLGCYPKRARGHLDLAVMAENTDARIDRGALDFMWREMPGFRIAMATITRDFFEIRGEVPPGLEDPKDPEKNKVFLMVLKNKLDEEGKPTDPLDKFAEYKKKLISDLERYFKENEKLLDPKRLGSGAPRFSPENAARGAVAAAWNLFFVGNAVDSGDQGDLIQLAKIRAISEPTDAELAMNPTKGRNVRNPVVYAEQARAMMLLYDKAWSKSFRVEDKVGTEETWLGDLGDYVAERLRHDPEFKKEFFRRDRRIVPQRLFASWFDLTTFEEEEKGNKKEISVGRKLCEKDKEKIGAEETNLYDFKDPKVIDFSQLSSSELWGGYADSWDSARKIYEMIGGKNKLDLKNIGIWRQTLATALSKLRRTPLAPYFSDPEILASCVAGATGLTEFSSHYLLLIPEPYYDLIVSGVFSDDRLFNEMPEGSRGDLFKLLNAKDQYSWRGYVGGFFAFNRKGIRLASGKEAARLKKK